MDRPVAGGPVTAALTPYLLAVAVIAYWVLLLYAAVKSLPLRRACREASERLAGED